MYSIEFLSDNASRGGNEGGAKVSENPAMSCAHGGWGPTDSQIQEQAAHHQKSDVSATPHFVGRVDGGAHPRKLGGFRNKRYTPTWMRPLEFDDRYGFGVRVFLYFRKILLSNHRDA